MDFSYGIGIFGFLVLSQALISNNIMILVYSVIAMITISLAYILFETYILCKDDYSDLIFPFSIFVGIAFVLLGISDHTKEARWKKRFVDDGYRDNQKDIDSFLEKTHSNALEQKTKVRKI